MLVYLFVILKYEIKIKIIILQRSVLVKYFFCLFETVIFQAQFSSSFKLWTLILLDLREFCVRPVLLELRNPFVRVNSKAATPRVVTIAPDPSPAAINSFSVETRGFRAITLVMIPLSGLMQ